MTISWSFLVMKLNRKRESTIAEIVTEIDSIHLEEHHFLTISTLGQIETNFPKRNKESFEEIKSTIESGSEILGPATPETTLGLS